MMKSTAAFVHFLLLATTASAFTAVTPITITTAASTATTTTRFILQPSSRITTVALSSSIPPLEEVAEGDDDTTSSSFATYSQTDPSQSLAYYDDVVGDGDVAENGKVLKVAYTGTLMSTGKQFDSGNGYSFRLGDGKVIPGWEQGLVGMRVGGTRRLRIPPSLAYGDRGAKDAIPPGSHLEFECQLVSIASNQLEETFSQINMQPERLITAGLLLILFIVSPTFN